MISKVEGYGLPLGSRKVDLSGEGFMFCGDAGHLIEPLTGEGIGQAMVSGRYAGWQAIKCFEQNDFSSKFMMDYETTVYKKLWATHRKRYFIQNIIEKKPWILNVTVKLFNWTKTIRSFFKKE